MLTRFHRAVADTIASVDLPDLEASERAEVLAFVDGQLGSLPPHLWLGVSAIAGLLATLVPVTRRRSFASLPVATRAALIDQWAGGPLGPARLYVKLLRSLVVYVGHELVAEGAPA